jgi:hypothetical protein
MTGFDETQIVETHIIKYFNKFPEENHTCASLYRSLKEMYPVLSDVSYYDVLISVQRLNATGKIKIKNVGKMKVISIG